MKYELNHDAVAKQIFEKASGDMKARRKVEQFVKDNYERYLSRQVLMTQEQLEEIRPLREALNLSAGEKDFIEKCENALKAAQKRRIAIVLSVMAILTVLASLALWQWRKLEQLKRISEPGRLALLAKQQLSAFNFNDAFNLTQEALEGDPENNIAKDIQSQIFHRSFDNTLLTPLCTNSVQEKLAVIKAVLNTEGSLMALLEVDSTVKIFDITNEILLKGVVQDCDTTFKPIFSPDNTHILTLKSDSILQISGFDGSDAHLLRGHTEFISGALFFSNDTIITWSNDKFIKMWNAQGQFLKDIGQHSDFVKSVEISNDKMHILSTDESREAIIWSLNKNETEFRINHLTNLNTATFRNNDSILLISPEGIEMWSRKQHKEMVKPLPLILDRISNATFSKQGDNLFYLSLSTLSCTYITHIHQFFDFFGGDSKKKIEIIKAYRQINNIHNIEPSDFLRDLNMIDTPSINVEKVGLFNSSYVWTIGEGSNEVCLRDSTGNLLAIMTHPTPPDGVEIAAQSMVAVTYSYDGYVKVWKNNAIRLTPVIGIVNHSNLGFTYAVHFTPDSRRIVTTGQLSPMVWYNTDAYLQKTFYDFYTEGVAFSPTEQWMVAYPYSGEAAIFDSLGQIVKKLTFNEQPKGIQYAPDGMHFLMYGSKKVGVWHKNGDILSDTINHQDEIMDAIFTPDSKHILTLSRDSFLSEWTLEGTLVRHIVEHERNLSVEFSPDGKTILTGSSDGFTKLRDYATGKILQQYSNEKNYIQSAQFFPDGKKILTLYSDNHSAIISEDGKPLYQKLFGGKLATVTFLNQGKYLLAMTSDAIELWTADNQRLTNYLKINEHAEKPTFSTAVSKDGKRFFIAFDNGTARQYYTPEGIADWLKKHPAMRFLDIEKERYAIR